VDKYDYVAAKRTGTGNDQVYVDGDGAAAVPTPASQRKEFTMRHFDVASSDAIATPEPRLDFEKLDCYAAACIHLEPPNCVVRWRHY
jgi:hypothetical protein